MTPEELAEIVDRAAARIAALDEHIGRLIAERDYAVAVADSLRWHNERLERELSEAIQTLADARIAPHANRWNRV